VPASVWGHDYVREWTAQGLAEATVENFTRYDWDYVKIIPHQLYVEGWKARARPSATITAAIWSPHPFAAARIGSACARRSRIRARWAALKAIQLINHSSATMRTLCRPSSHPGHRVLPAAGQPEPVQLTIAKIARPAFSPARHHRDLHHLRSGLPGYGASGIFYSTMAGPFPEFAHPRPVSRVWRAV